MKKSSSRVNSIASQGPKNVEVSLLLNVIHSHAIDSVLTSTPVLDWYELFLIPHGVHIMGIPRPIGSRI